MKISLNKMIILHGFKLKYVSKFHFYTFSFLDLGVIVYICYLNKIFFNKILIFILIGSIWIPQIYRNTVKGYRQTPSWMYAIW